MRQAKVVKGALAIAVVLLAAGWLTPLWDSAIL